MDNPRKNRLAFLAALLLGAFVSFAGCESKGPAEQAGKSVDQGIQNVKDTVNPPGPGEKAGREVDKVLKP
jgi:predicted small lipoprotein YifL